MKKFVGLLVLVAVIVVALVAMKMSGGGGSGSPVGGGSPVTLKGYVGSEKSTLLKDPEVVRILQDRYGITLDTSKRGSMEMVQTAVSDQDFLWPSSQVALELYKENKGSIVQSEVIFNSPVVLYSWESVTAALVKQGIAERKGEVVYLKDMPKLVQMVAQGKSWKDVGLSQLYGKVLIYSTDPNTSNSGNMFAGLLGSLLNGGNVLHEQDLPKIAPQIKRFFDQQGFMEQNSDAIFKQFINKGMGDKPIIVGYEAQLLEFHAQNPTILARLREPVRLLYPQPTAWSSHPLIALTSNGKRLIEAMADKDIQKIAWEQHGFRSGTGSDNSTANLSFKGVPESLDQIIPMPAPKVMEVLMRRLAN